MREHEENNAVLTFLTSSAALQGGLGRVQRGADGRVRAIVEARESDEAGTGDEVNCGAYCFDAAWLWAHLPGLPLHRDEVYLTDLADVAATEGQTVHTVSTAHRWESFGVNTRVHLAQAEGRMRERVLERLMLDGVTLIDPATTYIDASVSVGEDTVIYPNTHIRGRTAIGRECRIGPGAQVRDSRIGDGCTINAAVLEEATVEEHVDIGPYCHLRPGAYLCTGVHMGNFGEVKNSRLGRNTQMGHFSYIGDAEIGANVNIAAGVITCNYDGVTKHKTIVEDDAFIGCDTMLVAPVRVGARSATGAGTVVTKDVPPDVLAVGVPARFRERKAPETDHGARPDTSRASN
jgi:bifunctional UDP-N-acetylglucosamine pyrophosphorylase/glucosamine-1-phosphate N-acetyltransferase